MPVRRRAVFGALLGGVGASVAAACIRGEETRRFLLVELTRTARIDGETGSLTVSACQWHVSRDGALYGDHWGWCEDYKVLPAGSPGYLLLTTQLAGGATGGFSRLVVLPALPADLDAFGRRARVALDGTRVTITLGEASASLTPSQTAPLGEERALVEPPEDTGHFEPGFERPIAAQVSYAATHHGWLDARKISGRRA
ncbi:MAG TPA: hypothetical protein VFX49_06280 [Chloroflexota bacterium]|nr:hypothetical protein [Chloroflexota bacterium]